MKMERINKAENLAGVSFETLKELLESGVKFVNLKSLDFPSTNKEILDTDAIALTQNAEGLPSL